MEVLFVIGTDLKYLKGIPKKIGKGFGIANTEVEWLIDGPQWVGISYNCSSTKITSLEGAAEYVGESVWCNENKISSLQGIGRKYLKQIDNAIILNYCPLKSHILGIMLVKNLKNFNFNDNYNLTDIINKHLSGDRDVLECQEELINSGFKEYAKL